MSGSVAPGHASPPALSDSISASRRLGRRGAGRRNDVGRPFAEEARGGRDHRRIAGRQVHATVDAELGLDPFVLDQADGFDPADLHAPERDRRPDTQPADGPEPRLRQAVSSG